jgi:hypothetical protein
VNKDTWQSEHDKPATPVLLGGFREEQALRSPAIEVVMRPNGRIVSNPLRDSNIPRSDRDIHAVNQRDGGHQADRGVLEVICEVITRYDRFALERKSIVLESGETREFHWLSRQKPGERSQGLSLRRHEMKLLVKFLQQILDRDAENDGVDR